MNVTEDQLRSYIESFHQALHSVTTQYLPPQYRNDLLHAALLPARISGFLSTQFGVAIEYEKATETQVRVLRGSARVEDLFVQAPASARNIGPMLMIGGRDWGVASLTLSGAFPFRLAGPDASVTFQNVVFEFGAWRREIEFAEVVGDRSAERWSRASAESRAKDEALAALVQIHRAQERSLTVAEYVARFKHKSVLLLGDYDDSGARRLEAIAALLVSRGYDPVLVRDVPDQPHQDLSQKVVLLGALSRFVIVDDSSKSGHLLEVQLCKQNSWVTVLLRAGGKGGSWITAGAAHASNVIHELAYDPAAPDEALGTAVLWAEAKLKQLQRRFDDTYPWRINS